MWRHYLAVACSVSEHTSSNLVILWFISVFRVTFHCRSPQARIIKLEWWVEAKFLKETRGERWFDGDWNAKTIRMETWRFMSKVVSLAVLWVDSKTIPRQFGQILTYKERNRRNILPVELAGRLLQKTEEREVDCASCRRHCVFPRHSFRSGIGKLQVWNVQKCSNVVVYSGQCA